MLALSLHNIGIVEVENCCGCDEEASSSSEDEDDEDEECTTSAEEEKVLYEEMMMDKSLSLSSSHISITLPCRMFRDSSTRYNITVSLHVTLAWSPSLRMCALTQNQNSTSFLHLCRSYS